LSSANGSAKIRVDDATKVYETKTGPVHALENVSVEISDGELVCILGPSGCGKTTLLWAIDGSAVTGPRPREIGMIFQEANLLPWRNLRQNMEFPFEVKRRKPEQSRIERLLEQTGLIGFEKAYPRELSGGMQQRASIVRALAQDPAVLLMDEPFGALDAFTRDEMNLLLLRLWSETDKTIVFVTHNISEAIFLADRVVVMTPRPGRVARIYEIDLPRPRTIDMTFQPGFISLIQEIKQAVETGGSHTVEVE
jgi:NitT/TauT family transport system ATP-binding protein